MPVWLSLVLRGARAGGMRETRASLMESCSYPVDLADLQPDSSAGKIDSSEKSQKLKRDYFKMPPQKRPNFLRLGIASPFLCPWESLFRNRRQDSESRLQGNHQFFVLRDKKKLVWLNEMLSKDRKLARPCDEEEAKCLVAVSIESYDKGRPLDMALICLPTEQDLVNLQNSGTAPVEKIHVDENKEKRKDFRRKQKSMVKSRKRKLKGEKLLNEKTTEEKAKANGGTLAEYELKVQRLWLPPENSGLISPSSRSVCGFVFRGDFSFCKARGSAVGYVALPALFKLAILHQDAPHLLILFRNTHSLQYRYARLALLLNR